MFRRAVTTFALFAAVSVSAQPPNTDPLQFLIDVARQYAAATTYHIEYTTEHRQISERFTSTITASVIAAEGPDHRYHFEVQDERGTSVVVSDGSTEWQLNEPMGQYVTRAPGTYGHPFASSVTAGEPQARDAFFAHRMIGLTGSTLRSAHWEPDETIIVSGHKIPCYVIRFGTDDYPPSPPLKRAIPTTSTMTEKVWIDKLRHLILKTEQTTDRIQGKAGSPYALARRAVVTTTYTTTSLNEPLPNTLFAFTPPAEAMLVPKFSDPYNGTVTEISPPKPASSVNYIGQPAPALTLTAIDGSTLDTSTLHGHPTLLDLWATWCGPCLLEMPLLDRIKRATSSLGLELITVDQDKNPTDAVDYLKREHYAWSNYHDGFNGKYHQLGLKMSKGIPALMLLDSSGKIVYYHEGDDDEPGLVAAIKSLGPQFAAAITNTGQ